MSSTSSEEQKGVYHTHKASNTAEEEELDAHSRHIDEQDRKRRRVGSSEPYHDRLSSIPREVNHMRYPDSRESPSDALPYRQANSSRDPSRSRSVDRSRSKSPAASLLQPSRVGKRLRRAPQRWEGERREPRSTRGIPNASRFRDMEPSTRDSDDDETKSANSIQDDVQVPKMDDPVKDMRRAVAVVSTSLTRRLCVDAFHSWQLQNVSKQAAQQKALHVYLKRKLRKRTAKTPEIERLEEDAFRSARTATFKSKERSSNGDCHYPTTGEDESLNLVPTKMRLPLEAYLPRRTKALKATMSIEELLSQLPSRPHLPGSPVDETEGDSPKWLSVPMVAASSSLNRHKPSSRYSKVHVAGAPRARDVDRQGDD